jgi:hypothetical protein
MTQSILSQQLFTSYANYFMKPKMGRPKLPKSKVRGVLVQARFSPEEYKPVAEAVKRAGASESEWIRRALLTVAGGDKAAA